MKYVGVFVCLVFLAESISATLQPRIIGGEDADIKDFPYQASIRVVHYHFCGGTIISPQHILTSAHCFTSNLHPRVVPPYTEVTVSTGTNKSTEFGNVHRVVRVKLHERWTGSSYSANDIAVVKIRDRINFDETQQKVALPNQDVVSGTTGYVTGWGRTSMTDGSARTAIQLQKLQMTLLTTVDCQSHIPVILHHDEMCAYHSVGHGFAMGDSGSPLVVNNELAAIASWVYQGKSGNGRPDIYTSVYCHKDFIESEMNK